MYIKANFSMFSDDKELTESVSSSKILLNIFKNSAHKQAIIGKAREVIIKID